MSQANSSGPGVLDDEVKRMIEGLERDKERIAQVAATARSQYEWLSREVTLLQHQQWDLSAESEATQQRADDAKRDLDRIMRERPDVTPEHTTAIDRLVAASVEAQLAGARERVLREQIEFLQNWIKGLEPVAQDGSTLAEAVANSIQFLTANFREIGSRLESAKQTRALGLHVIRAQEEERRRLAREIHDGPTQLLNSVVLRIDVCQRFFDSDLNRLKEELKQLKELVRLSLQDVRKIIFDLRPMTLDDLGVIPALRTYLKDFQSKTGIETDLAVFGNDRRYDQAFEIAIFRIVQECLTNAYKHADAARVWVKIDTSGGKEVKVSVKDDGVGFDPSQVRPGVAGTKFGLVAMRERAELIGGSMEIQSAPGQGARLSFVFPLPE